MLKIEDLCVHFTLPNGGTVQALRHANLDMTKGETLALIGESGSGKSVLGLSILSLLPHTAKIRGRIFYQEKNILELENQQLQHLRGAQIALTPQSAGLSLNPTMKVLDQVAEGVPMPEKKKARKMALNWLTEFGLKKNQSFSYPHLLSGGMRQRTLVAIGLCTHPSLLIADEPTKGIDHQRIKDVEQIFDRIRQNSPDLGILLVTHDLNFAACTADRIAVMYAGRVVEIAHCRDFFRHPRHPYSQALLAAAPERGLHPIAGQAPKAEEDYAGCPFAPRCQNAQNRCVTEFPGHASFENGIVHCWSYAHT